VADASWLLQKAIFKTLDQGLSTPVFDSVPPGPAFPYVTIGDDVSIDGSSKIESGQEFACQVHVWSRQRGRKEVKEIIDAIDDLLHQQPLPIEPSGSPPTPLYAVIDVWRDGSQTLVDPDGLTMHGIAAFRIKICAA
jgi:uncharacterized protein DUF3168